MLKVVIALGFLIHGLAHASGFLAAWTSTPVGFAARPWLLSSGVAMASPLGRVFGLAWLLALAANVAAGIGLWFGLGWWPAAAVAGSALSLAVILPWWLTVPPGARFAGVLWDVLVLLALLLPWQAQVLRNLQ